MINATNFPYDLTPITAGNNTNILTFVTAVNDLTGQTFMLGMLIAGWVILFTSMRAGGNEDSITATNFIIAILSMFFRMLGFISTPMLVIILVLFGISFIIKIIGKKV